MKLAPVIVAIAKYLQTELPKRKFCEISFTFKVHNGQLTHIQKNVVEKYKPEEISGGLNE